MEHRAEIMIPLVGEVKELKFVKDVVTATADKLIAEAGVKMAYHVGTMIEIPAPPSPPTRSPPRRSSSPSAPTT